MLCSPRRHGDTALSYLPRRHGDTAIFLYAEGGLMPPSQTPYTFKNNHFLKIILDYHWLNAIIHIIINGGLQGGEAPFSIFNSAVPPCRRG
jgi:hypothetical protein